MSAQELDESFENAKREEKWKEEMETLIKIKNSPPSKCIICHNEKCTCEPSAALNAVHDQPYDCGSGV